MPPVAPEEPPSIKTSVYQLTCAHDRPYVYLANAGGDRIADLFVLSGVHSAGAKDDAVEVGEWRQVDLGDHVALECEARSSVWRSKTYRFRCWEDRLSYEVEVEGDAKLAAVDYFGGYSSARLRWGSGFFWSEGRFARGFNPEPTSEERYHFAPAESMTIDTTGVPVAGRDGWFFTPPPFCFGFEHSGGWLGMGVEARPGENRFNEFHYRAHRNGFHFTLPFESQPAVAGRYLLPAIGIDFAPNEQAGEHGAGEHGAGEHGAGEHGAGEHGGEYRALERHVASLRAQQLAPGGNSSAKPLWWSQPIFCGWGAQGHIASQCGTRAPDEARQENYELFLLQLEARDLAPGTVVLDDKWQSSYGENRVDEEKWPDLKGFIAAQHALGRKVLLWLKAWDPEGVPVEECVTNSSGRPVSVDPSNPAFERRFRESIRTMLAPQGYDADGFKLDFTARIPSSPGLRMHDDGIWGLELMKHYLQILHGEAKSVKSDALVMTHTPNPYLADVVDMIRLNDINVGQDVSRSMPHRARIARIACPQAIIDTDNWPVKDKATWRSYLGLQPELGVSSLYFASHIDSTGEALDDEDFRLIRETWKRTPAGNDTLAGVGE
ncbi:MAG: hypothetical protein WD273_12040 [Trueperaceae bacterium]